MLLENLLPIVPVSKIQTNVLPEAISARNISMEFCLKTETFQVLKDIDIAVRRGNIHLLIGPSGSGKSTLLSILAGVLRPTGGSVSLLGQEITRLSQAQLTRFRLENIGFIFQSFNLFPALTALENVEVALNLREIWGREARQRALDFLETVGLANRANHRPCELSCGQQQRVAIARAIAGDPKILIADEPTSALDIKAGQSVIELLCHLTKDHQRTLLMVTHDLDTLYIADQVTYLEDGQLRELPVPVNR